MPQQTLISHEILHLPGVHDREEVVCVLRREVQYEFVEGLECRCLLSRTDHGYILQQLFPGHNCLEHSMGLWAWNEEIFKRVLVEFQGKFILMNFELLTFHCREMVTLSIHLWHVSKWKIFLCDAVIVYIGIAKLKGVLYYAFFIATNHISGPFSWAFLASLNENCCGHLLNSILKMYRRKLHITLLIFPPKKSEMSISTKVKTLTGIRFFIIFYVF